MTCGSSALLKGVLRFMPAYISTERTPTSENPAVAEDPPAINIFEGNARRNACYFKTAYIINHLTEHESVRYDNSPR